MPYYELTLEDLSKRTERRKETLELLLVRPHSPDELARHWGTSVSASYRVLLRLLKKGYVERAEKVVHGPYQITQKGIQKLQWLTEKNASLSEAPSDLRQTHPDLEDLGQILEGPVALQRIVGVDNVSEITRKVNPKDLVAEPKLDGWLVQVVRGRIYSRRGKELTRNFIPLASAVRKLDDEHWIGELVYWKPDGTMSEPEVTRVAGTDDPTEAAAKMAQLPGRFQIVAFDILGHKGKDVSALPFERRRELLEETIPTGHWVNLSKIYPFARWKEAYDEALAEGGEGAVIKNVNAPYVWRPLGQREAKPPANQYKLKAVRSDDFVAFDSRRSEKDRLLVRFGQWWRGALIEVGEVDNLSKEVELELARLLKKGPFIIELLYQERFPKPPGRLRNPRYLRVRPDKPIDSATLPREFAPD